MIIAVRGTDKSYNFATYATAITAAASSIKNSRKTLIIQLCQQQPIEEMLLGSQMTDNRIEDASFSFDDEGVDALLLRAGSKRIMKENFTTCCLPVLKQENLLDIAVQSKKKNFAESFLQQPSDLEVVLDGAEDIYDDIFIFTDSKNKEMMKVVNDVVDFTIICVSQGPAQAINEEYIPDNHIILVMEFNDNSKHNLRYMTAQYDSKKFKNRHVFTLPYSIGFKDAYNSGSLIQFIRSNEKLSRDDENYTFFKSIDELLSYIMSGVEPKTNEVEEEFEAIQTEETEQSLDSYEEPEVHLEEPKKVLGIFKSKKRQVAFGKSETPLAPIPVEEEDEELDEEEFDDEEELDDEEIDEDDDLDKDDDDNIEEDDDEEEEEAPVPAPVQVMPEPKKKGWFAKHFGKKKEVPEPVPAPAPEPAPSATVEEPEEEEEEYEFEDEEEFVDDFEEIQLDDDLDDGGEDNEKEDVSTEPERADADVPVSDNGSADEDGHEPLDGPDIAPAPADDTGMVPPEGDTDDSQPKAPVDVAVKEPETEEEYLDHLLEAAMKRVSHKKHIETTGPAEPVPAIAPATDKKAMFDAIFGEDTPFSDESNEQVADTEMKFEELNGVSIPSFRTKAGICPGCKKPVPEGGKFCPECGFSLI